VKTSAAIVATVAALAALFTSILESGSGPLPVVWNAGDATSAQAARGGSQLKVAEPLEPPAEGPCTPRNRVLEVATRAAGLDQRHDVDVRMSVDAKICVVVLWTLPKRPGGYQFVTLDGSGKVIAVRPGF
jgi:hypothetical protein